MIAPKDLLTKIQHKEISKEEAVSLLVRLIENCENTLERAEFLDILGNITPKNDRFFKFFENYLISELQPRVNSAAGRALIHNFPEKSISALKWGVEHHYSSRLIKTILDELELTEIEKLKEFRANIVNRVVGEGKHKINYEEAKALLDLHVLLDYDGRSYMNAEPKDGHVIGLGLRAGKLTELPEFIQVFKKIKYLDLRQNKIEVIPKWVFKFRELEVLDIDGRFLTSLPECLLTHEKLERLSITPFPNDKPVPDVALKFARLKTAKKYIQKGVLPNEACVLAVLEILNMRSFEKYDSTYQHQIDFESGVVESFNFKVDDKGHITRLYMIGGETVWFDSVPEQVSELEYLKELNLSHNQITVLPESIGELRYLKKLNLWGNRLQEIPTFIYKLSSLKEIDLGGNDDIPEKVMKEYYATRLKNREEEDRKKAIEQNIEIESFKGAIITKVEAEILRGIEKLLGKEFYLSSTLEQGCFMHFTARDLHVTGICFREGELASFPSSLFELKYLKKLYIEFCSLKHIPDSFHKLKNLKELSLSLNFLESIPESIGELKRLKMLDLSRMRLKEIPKCIGKLTDLGELRLKNNLLESVPDLIINLSSLEVLDLSDNKFSSFPETIFKLKSLLELTIDEDLLKVSHLSTLIQRGITAGGYNYRVTYEFFK